MRAAAAAAAAGGGAASAAGAVPIVPISHLDLRQAAPADVARSFAAGAAAATASTAGSAGGTAAGASGSAVASSVTLSAPLFERIGALKSSIATRQIGAKHDVDRDSQLTYASVVQARDRRNPFNWAFKPTAGVGSGSGSLRRSVIGARAGSPMASATGGDRGREDDDDADGAGEADDEGEAPAGSSAAAVASPHEDPLATTSGSAFPGRARVSSAAAGRASAAAAAGGGGLVPTASHGNLRAAAGAAGGASRVGNRRMAGAASAPTLVAVPVSSAAATSSSGILPPSAGGGGGGFVADRRASALGAAASGSESDGDAAATAAAAAAANSGYNAAYMARRRRERKTLEAELKGGAAEAMARMVDALHFDGHNPAAAPVLPIQTAMRYTTSRITPRYSPKTFARQYLTPLGVDIVTDSFWLVHCKLFQADSAYAQEVLLQSLGRSYVRLLMAPFGGGSGGGGEGGGRSGHHGLGAGPGSPDGGVAASTGAGAGAGRSGGFSPGQRQSPAAYAFVETFPFAVADSVYQIYYWHVAGSRSRFTQRFALEVSVTVARLLSGVELAPVTALAMQERLFPEDVPARREETGASATVLASAEAVASIERRAAKSTAARVRRLGPDGVMTAGGADGAGGIAAAGGDGGDGGALSGRGRRTSLGSPGAGSHPGSARSRDVDGDGDGEGGAAVTAAAAAMEPRFVTVAKSLGYRNAFDLFKTTTDPDRDILGVHDAYATEALRSLERTTVLPSSAFQAAKIAAAEAAAAEAADAEAHTARLGTLDGGSVSHVLGDGGTLDGASLSPSRRSARGSPSRSHGRLKTAQDIARAVNESYGLYAVTSNAGVTFTSRRGRTAMASNTASVSAGGSMVAKAKATSDHGAFDGAADGGDGDGDAAAPTELELDADGLPKPGSLLELLGKLAGIDPAMLALTGQRFNTADLLGTATLYAMKQAAEGFAAKLTGRQSSHEEGGADAAGGGGTGGGGGGSDGGAYAGFDEEIASMLQQFHVISSAGGDAAAHAAPAAAATAAPAASLPPHLASLRLLQQHLTAAAAARTAAASASGMSEYGTDAVASADGGSGGGDMLSAAVAVARRRQQARVTAPSAAASLDRSNRFLLHSLSAPALPTAMPPGRSRGDAASTVSLLGSTVTTGGVGSRAGVRLTPLRAPRAGDAVGVAAPGGDATAAGGRTARRKRSAGAVASAAGGAGEGGSDGEGRTGSGAEGTAGGGGGVSDDDGEDLGDGGAAGATASAEGPLPAWARPRGKPVGPEELVSRLLYNRSKKRPLMIPFVYTTTSTLLGRAAPDAKPIASGRQLAINRTVPVPWSRTGGVETFHANAHSQAVRMEVQASQARMQRDVRTLTVESVKRAQAVTRELAARKEIVLSAGPVRVARAALEVRQDRLRRAQARAIENQRRRANRQAKSSAAMFGAGGAGGEEAAADKEGDDAAAAAVAAVSTAAKANPMALHAARLPQPSVLLE